MPNSGTVTAGSAALASQYNNLRDDVLNVSTGHTHTGASENGAQVEGTALKSTGATAGYVLTAGAGGTATTWSALPAGGGALTFISGTAVFSTATYGTVHAAAVTTLASRNYATTSGGTVVIASRFTQTTAGLINSFNLDVAASAASTSLSPATAGTTTFWVGGYGFSPGTAFVVLETGKSGSNQTVTLRKINTAMTSVMWSTQLLSAAYTGTQYDTYAPMSPARGGIRYAAGPGIWYGGDGRMYQHGAGTGQISSVWVVNDVSGSAYSAPFGSAAGTAATSKSSETTGLLFVPSSTAATNGTIHAWGNNAGTPRYCTYAVGSASITALSTADGIYAGTASSDQTEFPAPFYAQAPGKFAYWIASANKILLQQASSLTIWDRTFTTMEYESPLAPGAENLFNDYSHESSFDPVTMRTHYGSTWYQLGGLDGNIAPQGSGHFVDSNTWNGYYGVLAGPGSATRQFNDRYLSGASSGTVIQLPIDGLAKVPFGGTSSTRRLMTITGTLSGKVVAIDSAGGYVHSMAYGTSSSARQGGYTFVAGTGQVYVYVRHALTQNNSGSFKTVQAELIMGGTATVSGYQVALS
jgi:hypothetical protein